VNIAKKTIIGMTLAGLLAAFNPTGNESSAQETGRRRHGPPPEAYAACEGKSTGDKASYESPRGDTVSGTCVEHGDRLVLRPDNPPGGRRMGGASN